MIGIIYLVISIYFIIGAYSTNRVFKNRDIIQKNQAWTKYWVYLIIIYVITSLLIFLPNWFPFVCLLIISAGLFELIRAWSLSPNRSRTYIVMTLAILIFGVLSSGLILFSKLDHKYLLFTFFVIASFDGFSQITGQLFGNRQAFPRISPGKTLEGLALGLFLATVTGVFIHSVGELVWWQAFLLSALISLFSLIGDLLASSFKRWCGIKDFSALIPGHGGVLDRFDSLLAGGSVMYLTYWLFI